MRKRAGSKKDFSLGAKHMALLCLNLSPARLRVPLAYVARPEILAVTKH
jgi:hypothetical protein